MLTPRVTSTTRAVVVDGFRRVAERLHLPDDAPGRVAREGLRDRLVVVRLTVDGSNGEATPLAKQGKNQLSAPAVRK